MSGGTITWNLGDVSIDGGTLLSFNVTVSIGNGEVNNTATGHDDEEASFSSNPTVVTVATIN